MQQQKSIFPYLFFLTLFFILLEISFFFQCNGQYVTDIREASDNFTIPLTVIPAFAYFIFAQLLVHLAYTILVWWVAMGNARYFKLNSTQTLYAGIACWLLGLITLLTANAYYFPNSVFSSLLLSLLVNRSIVRGLLWLLAGVCVVVIMIAMKASFSKRRLGMTVTFGIAVLMLNYYPASTTLSTNPATSSQPNIFIIGIDSLRPDFLGFFGRDNRTPFLDSLLSQSTVFSEATTPLARTYPSWAAILTGLYPRESGVRFNLPKPNQDLADRALSMLLKEKGYHTLYATDEARFSNIDQSFGFDEVVTPPVGLNDFLLGTSNDFPISNLLINTALGKILFPYSYGNRPVYVTYQPNSFIRLLKPALVRQPKQSVFFAIHFCLPHHPYVWSGLSANKLSPQERYQASVRRVDKQVRDFFALLKENHYLDHAIVVVLSDHGEALEFNGDRVTEEDLFQTQHVSSVPQFYPPGIDDEKINQSVGHGTDVLGLSQYHTLLAFKLYGMGPQSEGVRTDGVSLLDIRPTLLALLGIHQTSSGESLLPAIRENKPILSKPRHLFLESDFSPAAIRTVYPDAHQILMNGIGLFQVNPHTLHLEVKEEMGEKIIKAKQYADLYGEWILALYPQPKGNRIPILVNLRTGQWTDDMGSRLALSSPASLMMKELKAFYLL